MKQLLESKPQASLFSLSCFLHSIRLQLDYINSTALCNKTSIVGIGSWRERLQISAANSDQVFPHPNKNELPNDPFPLFSFFFLFLSLFHILNTSQYTTDDLFSSKYLVDTSFSTSNWQFSLLHMPRSSPHVPAIFAVRLC